MAEPTKSGKTLRSVSTDSAPQSRVDRRRRPTAEPQEDAQASSALTIGKLSKLFEVSIDSIRFYEDERLLMPASKTDAGYRLYGADAVRRLNFIKHAQHCGMTLAEIRQLLELRADDSSCCSDIRNLALRKKLEIERKIKAMRAMSQALGKLIDVCTAEDQPVDACPILAALEASVSKPHDSFSQ
jgi:MerR family Zn(II)-responsive transcriptional regulator of zntA